MLFRTRHSLMDTAKLGTWFLPRNCSMKMSQCGVQPNALTYSVLVRGILRKRMVGLAKELMGKLWQKMVDKNDSSVNNAAFVNVIESLCHEGLFQDVFMIAEDMPQGKSVPDEFAYGQMIDPLCKVGRHNGAARVVYIMKMKGFIPMLVLYNSIVHGLCKEGSFMRAYQLLEEGSEFGYLPSEYTYTVMIEGLFVLMLIFVRQRKFFESC